MMHKEEEELWKKERKKASKRSRLVIIYQVSWNNTRRDLQKPFSSLRNAVAYRGMREGRGGGRKRLEKKKEEKREKNSRANFAIRATCWLYHLKIARENLARLRQPISFCYAGKYQKFRWPCVLPYLAFTHLGGPHSCCRATDIHLLLFVIIDKLNNLLFVTATSVKYIRQY